MKMDLLESFITVFFIYWVMILSTALMLRIEQVKCHSPNGEA